MFKLTVYKRRKPVGEEDNEVEEAPGMPLCFKSKELLLIMVDTILPTLGGPFGRWLEISVE